MKRRTTLGFVLASLHTGASRVLWPGLLDAAERHDVNLVCFPGGRLNAVQGYESQRNILYDLIGTDCVDGLVTWSSSLGGVLDPVEISAFHQRFRSLPMVSLARFMEGIPTVCMDNYHGMRALLAHLIQDHGHRRLAFIRGPEGHYIAQERYRAYLDTLQAYDIPLIPELVTRPLSWESGAEAVQILLDERGLRPGVDFQTVVAASDLLALWALKALQARGCQIPGDLAVTGFNNSIEERFATPPLTTIDLPFHDQGAKAVDVLLDLLAGKPVPALITLPSRLIVRQSCGCPSAGVALAARSRGEALAGDMEGALDGAAADGKHRAIQEMRLACLAEMEAAAGLEGDKIRGGLEPLLDAFLLEVEKGAGGKPPKGPASAAASAAAEAAASASDFLRGLEEVLDRLMHNQQDIALWQNVLSVLRGWALPSLPAAARSWAEVLLGQARVAVAEAAQRSQVYWQWQAERQADVQRETSQVLLTSFDVQQLIDVLVERLPPLGIPSAYLALYESRASPAIAAPGMARLVLACTDKGRLPLEPGGRRFPSRQLVPPDLLPRHRRYSLVVEPLFFQEKPIGYAVFELGPPQGDVYELLRGNLSSALQGATLFQEAQQARLAAEKADLIKTRLLANVSHELRTPLNIILGYTQAIQRRPHPDLPVNPPAETPAVPPGLLEDVRHIQNNAEHQLRVINDLLDLSRAEIDELDLALELLDPQPILLEAFQNMADQSNSPPVTGPVTWQADIPDRLPQVRADAVRLRQIFLNLLSNARKFTEHGCITLGAEVTPPELHFWVSDTGTGIPEEQRERIFEPFVTVEGSRGSSRGIGLGLTITRHLVALHNGRIKLESQPGKGSTFHIYLPLPALQVERPLEQVETGPVLLLISSSPQPAQEIADLCQRQGLQIRRLDSRRLQNAEDLDRMVAQVRLAALAWDLADAEPADWTLVRRLRHFPHITQAPFILYGQLPQEKADAPRLSVGLTGFVVKSNQQQTLLEAINAVCPVQAHDPVLVVDDDPQVLAAHQALLESCLPGCSILTAADGAAALSILARVVPALVLLDLVMPGLGGADVLDHIRSDPRLRRVPVIILSNKVMSQEDIKRLEQHARVTFQTKGIWTDSEAMEAMQRAVLGSQSLPAYTSALVKRALAYFHQNYARPLTRWEIAEAVGVSEDYLSRVFHRELGLSPWEYLNRYRILQARQLLANNADSIGVIAHQVGFKDQAYFSRVFNKLTGQSPQAYRESRSDG